MLANARLAEHYLRHQMEALPLSLPNSKLSLRAVATNQVLPSVCGTGARGGSRGGIAGGGGEGKVLP